MFTSQQTTNFLKRNETYIYTSNLYSDKFCLPLLVLNIGLLVYEETVIEHETIFMNGRSQRQKIFALNWPDFSEVWIMSVINAPLPLVAAVVEFQDRHAPIRNLTTLPAVHS